MLASVRRIASSSNQATVLVEAAGHVSGDDDLVAAYLEAAEEISASSHRWRAVSALAQA